ncbi:MAG TPA: PLDc N-terminal domain-containing protein [bacterium]|nr:PLDc N-terminal domain-containing protein [bacterium]
MYEIIGIVVFILDIVAIVDCVRSSLAAGKKALWVLLILVLPILGMVLYFLVGKKN